MSSQELLKQLEASGAIASAPQTGSIPGGDAPQPEGSAPQTSAGGSSQVVASGSSQPPATSGSVPDAGQIEGVPANVPLPKPRPDNPFY